MFALTDEDQAFELDGHQLKLRRVGKSSWVVSEAGATLGTLAEVPSPSGRLEKTYAAARAPEARENIHWPELLRWLLDR